MPLAFFYPLRQGLVLVPVLAAMMTDDPPPPADPWMRKLVYPKRPDVVVRDALGNAKPEQFHGPGLVWKVEGERLHLRMGMNDGFGWVAKADLIRGDEAEAYFTALIKTKPTAFAYQSRASSRPGMFDPAKRDKVAEVNLADIDEAIRLDPGDYYSYELRGAERARKNDLDRAIADGS